MDSKWTLVLFYSRTIPQICLQQENISFILFLKGK